MGRKFFLHPCAVVADGKAYCAYCWRKLPLDERGLPILETEWPCSISLPIPFDDEVAVSVWDCRATVLYRGNPIKYDEVPEEVAAELERLAVESVERAGGAINWSGIYPPIDELCDYVKKLRELGFLGQGEST